MLVNGRHMFPLSLVSRNINGNYFLAVDGTFWKRTKDRVMQLKGSKTTSGTYHRFGSVYGSGWKETDLVRLARAHKDWNKETNGGLVATTLTKEIAVLEGRNHAETVEGGIAGKGSVIARVHKGALVFGQKPAIHMTEQSLKDEMLRLAQKYPGVKFVALKVTTSVVAGGV